jgi:ribonuclease Z
VSLRELVALGTSSQVPTRHRNHNGYLLRWDGEGFLFDPGEGTQRQFIFANVPVTAVTKIFITHFHGDHSLGLAGISQRLSLDRCPHPVEVYFPASGQQYYERLTRASIYHRAVELIPRPVGGKGGVVFENDIYSIEAHPLKHSVDVYGYRIKERDGRRFNREKLEELGIRGPSVGALERDGQVALPDGKVVRVEDVTQTKPGTAFAFVMDTRPCDGAIALARGTDLLVAESTYAKEDEQLAKEHLHMTAGEAATLAREAGAHGQLVLTHFSQRYKSVKELVDEARAIYPRCTAVRDLDKIELPRH